MPVYAKHAERNSMRIKTNESFPLISASISRKSRRLNQSSIIIRHQSVASHFESREESDEHFLVRVDPLESPIKLRHCHVLSQTAAATGRNLKTDFDAIVALHLPVDTQIICGEHKSLMSPRAQRVSS